jgi:hypothetical protein
MVCFLFKARQQIAEAPAICSRKDLGEIGNSTFILRDPLRLGSVLSRGLRQQHER